MATAAELANPDGIAVDSAGDLFIADTGHNVIREVNHSTGIITTIAGTGLAGYSGDDGQASAAELNSPYGLALNSAGDLFVIDQGNMRIREINLSTGIITTVAGNGSTGYNGDGEQATAAELSTPEGIAFDASGDLFIADTFANRVREVNLATGIITTIAGNGINLSGGDGGQASAAGLDTPDGLAVNAAGDLFISDNLNERIREVNLATGVIITVAGNGSRGENGNGGQATAASLDAPQGLAVSSTGDLYIADADGAIRAVNLATGIITISAGNGTLGESGDGGPATVAELDGPFDVAVDSSGDVFIAEQISSRVREVNAASGVITTLAGSGSSANISSGGPATVATLKSPQSVVVDSAGDVFVAASNYIWEVNHATGIITAIAGDGTPGYSGDGGQATAAGISNPEGLLLDSSGDLFFADADDNRVREVILATGIITTVAGSGTSGFLGDGGQATAAWLKDPQAIALNSAGDLFIADTGNSRVREVNLTTGIITTVAGGGGIGSNGDGGQATAAELNQPDGLALDAYGDLFISDTYSQRVREVNLASGIITTIAGSGPSGYAGDGGQATAAELSDPGQIAISSSGILLIADTYDSRIRAVNLATGIITTVAGNGISGSTGNGGPATAAQLNFPAAVAIDSSGDLFIADTNNGRLREAIAGVRVTVGQTTPSVAVTDAGGTYNISAFPATAAVNGAASLEGVTPTLSYYAGTMATGSALTGAPSLAGTYTVLASFAGSTDYLSATASTTFSISPAVTRLSLVASVTAVIAGQPVTLIANISSTPQATEGVVTFLNGRTVIGTAPVSAGSGSITLLALPAGSDEISATFADPAGNFGACTSLSIQTVAGTGAAGFSGNGGPATAAELDLPDGLALDSAGDLFIADFQNSRIREVNQATGSITTVAGNGYFNYTGNGGPATAAALNYPTGVAIDSSGNLFIADEANNQIREVNDATSVIGSVNYQVTGPPLSYPAGVVVNSAGDVFVADSQNNVIREITPTGFMTTVAGKFTRGSTGDGGLATAAEIQDPTNIALDSSGDLFLVDGNRIREVKPNGIITTVAGTGTAGYSGDGGPATAAELNSPGGIAVDPAGDLFFADSGNNVIREVQTNGVIVTIAGTGVAGYDGDGGAATSAWLNDPVSIALNAAGDLYFSDRGNDVVREVTLATRVTVIGQPDITVADAGGNYTGSSYPATATINGSTILKGSLPH